MNKILKLCLLLFILNIQLCDAQIPFLRKSNKTTQLIVDNKPYIILGGELGNSTATSMANMESVWPKLKALNLNTVLVPVYWELIEKKQGEFDFSLIKQLIEEARNNNLKIVFLWFASWKNSMSSHAPEWVKLNQKKYPRAEDDKNIGQEILTPFSDNNLNADLVAFEKFMQFIKDFDSKEHTTIMVQVENEIGMLPTARDYHPLANEAFKKEVPKALISYLQNNKTKLVPEFYAVWEKQGFKTSGNWETIFGKGLHTDEIFMAWYFSKFTNKITKAGKAIYPLPMYVNAALNSSKKIPGNYPSAGPLPHIIDVWKAAGPDIDFYSPDYYNPDFKHWNDLYTRQGNPLFIPEHRFDDTVAAKAMYAIGHYEAMGFCPFSVESKDIITAENMGDTGFSDVSNNNSITTEPLAKMYDLINQLTPIISNKEKIKNIDAVLLNKDISETKIVMGQYEFTLRHDYTLNWSPNAKDDSWPFTSVVLIETKNGEFYIAGSGVVVTCKNAKNPSLNAGILSDEEGYFKNNKWIVSRYLNGDQTHQGRHIRIPFDTYSIQKFKLYTYK
ncbi:GH35 family beta-galactosidase [Thalassobellus sediminis]|uniref:GH35 family beta-galactosidase n=1 Tax=Thalassobellus sediminis TaxID=3367753 RepID=UPI0037A5DF4A